jgi:hypothetical protein
MRFSTFFVIAPLEAMFADEGLKFFKKALLAVVFLLASNIVRYLRHRRFGYRECSITSTPGEFSTDDLLLINPKRGSAFKILHSVFERVFGRKINQSVNMVSVYVVDSHVNTFGFGILGEVSGYFCSCRFIENAFSFERGPNHVQPASAVGMQRHTF